MHYAVRPDLVGIVRLYFLERGIKHGPQVSGFMRHLVALFLELVYDVLYVREF